MFLNGVLLHEYVLGGKHIASDDNWGAIELCPRHSISPSVN
jgi:hypothetical protein